MSKRVKFSPVGIARDEEQVAAILRARKSSESWTKQEELLKRKKAAITLPKLKFMEDKE